MEKGMLLASVLLMVGTFSLSAQTFFTLGVGAGYTAQAVTSSSTLDLVSANLNMTEFYGTNLGMYAQMFFGTNLSATYNGASCSLPSSGMNYDMDILFGVGYLVPIGRLIMVIVGGGVYFGTIIIEGSSSSSGFDDLAMAVGPGVGATCAFRLGGNFFVSASIMAAYGLLDPMELTTGLSGTGLRVLGGAGIGVAL